MKELITIGKFITLIKYKFFKYFSENGTESDTCLKSLFNIRLINVFTQKNQCIETLIWLYITMIIFVDIRIFEWWLIDITKEK